MIRRLRVIEAADLAALARLHGQCFPDDAWDAPALAELLAMKGASGHLIEDLAGGEPLGLLLDLIVGDHGEVLTLGVAPAARRRGIARMLLEDLFRRARQAGVRSLGLEVAADNAAARRLYHVCGFEPAGRRRDYYRRSGATVDALVFRLALLG